MGRLFGTDGVRGVANTEISCEMAMNIGRAAAMVLTSGDKKPNVLIGMDTRISGDMIQSALACGLCSVGANVMTIGVVPTPAVAYLVKHCAYDAAIMISASHNPYQYNGIKIFQGDGYKLPDEIEEKIESIILDGAETSPINLKVGEQIGTITESDDSVVQYIDHLKNCIDCDFEGMNIALDCANGSSSVTAQTLFESLGANAHILSSEPNGININDNCGSTHMENLQAYVVKNNLMAGFAFDGDADRMLAVDENGEMVDGDKIMAICAKFMKDEGKLKDDMAVVTVMSNMGFTKFCEKENIKYQSTKVGDRYVLENMLEHGYCIGGEQSGHVIFLDHASTGDGQLTALKVLEIMKKTGKTLSELASCMTVYPQVLVNVKVSAMGKARYNDDTEIKNAITQAEKQLGDTGRVLVRISGTEPLVRVMLEGESQEQIDILAKEIAEVVAVRLI
ncbi:MAG: phosphoglucosamine mutase [Clostridia bacterium]